MDLPKTSRLNSIDILRGLIIVIMALDHVRDLWSVAPFRAEDLTQTSVSLFFTRWITHYCAPVFIFLSGLSAFLYGRNKPTRQLSIYLLTRGLWLMAVELLVIGFIWKFQYDVIILEVIWAIGLSMVVLSMIVWLPRWGIAAFAIVLIAGHNLFSNVKPEGADTIIAFLHNSPFFVPIPLFGMTLNVIVSYVIIPWVGVMALGYCAGKFFEYDEPQRNTIFRRTGMTMIAAFILLRLLNVYGDPVPWSEQERGATFTFLSFLNVSKYPPSLLFILMTLGPALIFLSYAESVGARFKEFFMTYGKVPLFFFVIHLALINAASIIWAYFRFGKLMIIGFTPTDQLPADYHPSLLRTYVVWVAIILVLYFPCRWYGKYKQRSRQWWITYL